MSIADNLTEVADKVDDILSDIIKKRDTATGPEKSALRRVGRKLEKALSTLETAEDEVQGLDSK